MSRPDWLVALETACTATTQRDVAKRLGVSQSAINQVLNGKYPAKTDGIETRVRAHLMKAEVKCPVMKKTVALSMCASRARRVKDGLSTHGNLVFEMFAKTCPTCANNPHVKRSAP